MSIIPALRKPECHVLKDPSFFQRSYDKTNNQAVYQLDAEKLSKDKCHLFWGTKVSGEELVASALKYFTFHPLAKINDKYNIFEIHLSDDDRVYLCSFPIGYKDVCEKAAKTFKLHMKTALIEFFFFPGSRRIPDAPALTLPDDCKERRIPEMGKPVPKDALPISVKKEDEITRIIFPKANNILWFTDCALSEREMGNWKGQISSLGNSVQELGLD